MDRSTRRRFLKMVDQEPLLKQIKGNYMDKEKSIWAAFSWQIEPIMCDLYICFAIAISK